MLDRTDLEKFYEDETGLDARQGVARIDNLEKFVNKMNVTSLEQIRLFNDVNKSSRDYRNSIRWYAGKQHGNTMQLGYTNKGHRCVNAIYVEVQ